MRIIENGAVPMEDTTSAPIFFGGSVSKQGLVDESNSEFFVSSVINFAAGARNKFHRHSSDQLLFVTEGKGIVATEEKEFVVTKGNTVHVAAGEIHWHGATNDSSFSHITVTLAGGTTEIVE